MHVVIVSVVVEKSWMIFNRSQILLFFLSIYVPPNLFHRVASWLATGLYSATLDKL